LQNANPQYEAYPKIRKISGKYRVVWGYTCRLCNKHNLIGAGAANHFMYEHSTCMIDGDMQEMSSAILTVYNAMTIARRKAETGLHDAKEDVARYDDKLRKEHRSLVHRTKSLNNAFRAGLEAMDNIRPY
jgi:hypothetical protein